MSIVTIPFSDEMACASVEGLKNATTRGEQLGEPGDVFEVLGVWFRILDVFAVPLWWVRDTIYRLEGVESPAAFERLWKRLHNGRFPSSTIQYVHYFARCGDTPTGVQTGSEPASVSP